MASVHSLSLNIKKLRKFNKLNKSTEILKTILLSSNNILKVEDIITKATELDFTLFKNLIKDE